MGAWAYCRACDRALGVPTVVDAIMGEQLCPNCTNPREVEHAFKRQFLEPLDKLLKNPDFQQWLDKQPEDPDV